MRVLAVEDDPEFREFLNFHLSTQGLEVAVAAGGEEALAALETMAPDILVVDVNMPGMSGEELAQAARDRHPGLRVVSFSGSGQSTPWADQTVAKGGRENLAELVAAIKDGSGRPAHER